ncbi:hypothetical protein C0991_003197 [Blastosporella zonata]|nr:hypothetical protein C0991_003197 [Blastosporella zonata]
MVTGNKENEAVQPRESRMRHVSRKVAEQMEEAAAAAAQKEAKLARRAIREKKVKIRKDKAAGITQDADASDLEPVKDTEIMTRRVATKITKDVTKRALQAVATAQAFSSPVAVRRDGKVPPAPGQVSLNFIALALD